MSKSKNVVKKLTMILFTILFTLVSVFAIGPTNVNAETTDITEIKLTGNYQYGNVPAGVLPAFNPRTTTEGIRMGTNAGWSYFINETSVWSGFGSETPVAYNDGTTKYGYRFQVKTNDGYQLASDLKVIYNDEDVTSTVKVTRWAWGAYVTVDLGKAIGENPTTHTVTFDSMGGSEIAPKEVVSGLKIKAPSTPTKDKYVFRGWYEDNTHSVPFDFNNTPITSDMTLYAKWEAANSINEIRLAGDFQYGTVPVGTLPSFNPATTTEGIRMGTNAGWSYFINETSVWSGFGLETPTAVNDGKTKYGYRFQVKTNDGYQLASDLKVIYNDEDVTSTVEVTRWPWGAYVTVDLGKAIGTPVVYTITFNSNDGTSVESQNVNAGEKLTEPTPAPTKEGFTFDGWYEDSTISKKFDFNTPITDNMTLYAKWTENKYTLTFDANGGSGTMTPVTDLTGEYTLPANEFTAPSGKQFKGWSLTTDGAIVTKVDMTENRTVYAIWENIPVVTYTVSFAANGGTGTMADVTGVSGEYTLPANGFTAPDGKQFKAWSVGGVEKAVGDKITVTANTTVTAVWEAVEYNVTVTGGTASVGAGTPITKATMGTTVTLTAGAAPSGKVFDKWEVISGGITLADANSATTTFIMPASAVSVKATYKNAPHTHTYNQETVKPEALKTPADCTSNAVYFKSCSCGAISTTDTFVAMNTALGHAYGSDWKYDSTNHWHECSRCHDKKDEAAHDYGSDNVCDTCGYYKTVPHTHNLTLVAAKAATCTTAGNSAYYTCDGCDKWFADATGSVEITDKTSVKIPAPGHTAGTEWKSDDTNHWHECSRCHDKKDEAAHSASEWIIDTAATETAEGAKHKECTVCKKVLETATIPATGSSHTNSYGVYVGMTYTAGNLIYQITSIDTATLGQSKVIGVVAAKKNKIKKVTIPDRADCKGYRLNVTTIGNNAFAGCKALEKLTIGNKVTVIGKNAFKNCSKLETVVIGKAVKTISSKAFIGDNKIKKITFKGDKLKTVKKNAFSKKAKKNIKSKKTKLKGNKKAIKLFKKKLKIK